MASELSCLTSLPKKKDYFLRISTAAFGFYAPRHCDRHHGMDPLRAACAGIGSAKYAKWKARNQLVRELAAMDRERREKMLSRMNPEQAMEARQELMRRFNIF